MSARRILDRYVPIKSYRGGMGVVHACVDMGAAPGEPIGVAVKTIRPELMADAARREDFVREASTWMAIGSHPHVVTARMVRREGEQVYVVCDLVVPPEGARGASLREHLRGTPVWRRGLELALGIVRGMIHATARVPGLVHRDLKPENVLVGADGRARVTDFGLALAGGDPQQTAAGTLAYMAPEQLEGRAEPRSDIYAVGLVLLELLEARNGIPLDGSKREIIDAHVRGAPRQLVGSFVMAEAVRDILARWVHPDVEHRPSSWDEAEDLLLTLWKWLAPGSPPPRPSAEEATRDDELRLAWSELGIGNSFLDVGALADAALTYERAIERAKALALRGTPAPGSRSIQAGALNGLGQTKSARGDDAGALVDLDAAIALRKEQGDRAGEARALGNRGNSLFRLRRPEEARAAHERAAALSFEAGDRTGYVTARFNLLQLHAHAKDFDAVVRGARWCEEAFGELGNVRGRAVSLGNLGQALRMAGDVEGALEASQRALECFRRIADRRGEARELAIQGNTLRALKRPVEAIDAFGAAVSLATEIGDQLLVGSASYAVAEMTPAVPQVAATGRKYALAAAAAYRSVGREDLAKDADAMAARFPEPGG